MINSALGISALLFYKPNIQKSKAEFGETYKNAFFDKIM